jgi:bacterioferritin-associated ferredoxin
MIVCSCNLLSDHAVRSAVKAERTHSISRIYLCLGCKARCGHCAPTIRKIINETLGGKGHPVTTQGGHQNPDSTVADQPFGIIDLPQG